MSGSSYHLAGMCVVLSGARERVFLPCGRHVCSAERAVQAMSAALAFLASSRDAKSYQVAALTEDKRPLVNRSAAGLEKIRVKLASWF